MVEFPDLGPDAVGTFRSSALTPLDKNGEPLPGWANRPMHEQAGYVRPAKKLPKPICADGTPTSTLLGRRARESSNYSDYVNFETKTRKRAPSNGLNMKELSASLLDNHSVVVDWSGMQAYDLPPGTEFQQLAEVAFASAYLPPSSPMCFPECAAEGLSCTVLGICSGCGTRMWQASEKDVSLFCWNSTCRASPVNDFKGPHLKIVPDFASITDVTETRHEVEDVCGLPIALSVPSSLTSLAPNAAQSAASDKPEIKDFVSVVSDSLANAICVNEQPATTVASVSSKTVVRLPGVRSVSPLANFGNSMQSNLETDLANAATSTSVLVSPCSAEPHPSINGNPRFFFPPLPADAKAGLSQHHAVEGHTVLLADSSSLRGYEMNRQGDVSLAVKRHSVRVLSPETLPEDAAPVEKGRMGNQTCQPFPDFSP